MCKLVYWVNINADIKKYIRNCNTCLEFQPTQPKERIIHHDIPMRPWDVVGVGMFQLNNKNYLCVIYQSQLFLSLHYYACATLLHYAHVHKMTEPPHDIIR